MKRFLIYTNIYKDPDAAVANEIKDYLITKGCEADIYKSDGSEDEEDQELLRTAGMTDMLIALGGDGTVLQAARDVKKLNIHIAGVNLGRVGYLTEIEKDNYKEALDRLIAGDYFVDSRMMLLGSMQYAGGGGFESWALNDIVLARRGSIRLINFDIYINGLFLNQYRADGIIVTTPTGSTGYNLSAGGPIVEPGAKILTLTPICPHTLNHRSIILSADDVIEIKIPKAREGVNQEVEVSFDGAGRKILNTGDSIRISRSEKITEFARLEKTSFLETLHKKLGEN
ncbi:MAG: NAD(+)/NADH kinase [Lachnospiraceae bacterium]|nr:NAD(+)/NADH kinase [Lachnospiraceae bacterium]